jgi:hypothetical protein
VPIPGNGVTMLGLLTSKELEKHFIKILDMKDGCPEWYISEKQSN